MNGFPEPSERSTAAAGRREPLPVPLAMDALPTSPLVSVLVASYNYAAYVERAVESVLEQTYPHLEVIVCDDGSTDESCAIVERMARRDARVHLIRKANGGVASALNAAYAAAAGEVVCLLDADDYFAPDKLEAVVHHLRAHPEVGFVTHAMEVVDAGGQRMYEIPFVRSVEAGWIAGEVRRRGGRWRNMPASALAFRRAVAECLWPMPEAPLRREADGYLFTLAPLITHVGFIDRALSGYRLHGANLTGGAMLDGRTVERRLDALRRINDAVNARLASLGLPGLELEQHLNYREACYLRGLLGGAGRGALLRESLSFASALVRDDLYGFSRKLAGLGAALGALALPVTHRSAWLGWILGPEGWRRKLRGKGR